MGDERKWGEDVGGRWDRQSLARAWGRILLPPEDVSGLGRVSERELIGFAPFRHFSVFLPFAFVGEADEPVLVLERRASSLRSQPQEIAFPGGKVEEGDPSYLAAAVREAAEELGVSPEAVRPWGKLGTLVTPYAYAVHAYVGELAELPHRPNPAEVDRLLFVPWSEVLAAPAERYPFEVEFRPRGAFPYARLPGGEAYPFRRAEMQGVAYELGGAFVWGLTARLLEVLVARWHEARSAPPSLPAEAGFRTGSSARVEKLFG
ncbi:NUDIX hydrolase [Brockia lithotrophica]|uniref:8-oxo-dGTP pyrophosphatase MutT (NUDIX family) n=1 Tax=Brockia lithotrophica TaxID=933949 RepID=A0A660KUI4_9BACL|nr:CoA pyrophosphatase [Brockia lithotrophica]RKQ84714.1 8-oxo-dGTP pyrophosphatase MutT (NUDIX family) [Brockia lithotrophica]